MSFGRFLGPDYCKPTNNFARFKLAGFAVSVHPPKFIAKKMYDVMKIGKFLAPEEAAMKTRLLTCAPCGVPISMVFVCVTSNLIPSNWYVLNTC